LKFWAPVSSVLEICTCLSENCNFLPPPAFLSHDAAVIRGEEKSILNELLCVTWGLIYTTS